MIIQRVDNVYVTRGIIVGSRSRRIENPDEDATHEWSVYVHSPFNTPMDYIQNVQFKLHETFTNPLIIKTHPFIINEKGWGEFNIQVRIVFQDFNERPVILNHHLVLHEGTIDPVTKETVSERYEEIVFRSPTKVMMKILGGMEEKTEEFLVDEKAEGEEIERALIMMLEKFDNQ